MSKVSSWRKKNRSQPQDYFSRIPSFISPSRMQWAWLFCLVCLVVMLAWNWKLVLATGAGIAVMLGIYLLPSLNWRTYWSNLRSFFRGSPSQLTIAVGGGGLAALITYMTTAIWVDTENHWLASGAILQGFGTLTTLSLLVWQIIDRHVHRRETELDQLLNGLTQDNALKRLLALRKLTHLVNKKYLSQVECKQVAEYLQLMLCQEKQEVIRQAILSALLALEPSSTPLTQAKPLQVPVRLKKRRVVTEELSVIED